jgi:hypothetical protein
MKRIRMETAVVWLLVVGPLLVGIGAAIYWGSGSKLAGLWGGFVPGAIVLIIAAALQIQIFISKPDVAELPIGPSDSEINRQRAYVLVEASELRYLAQEKPVEAWISLKNNGLTPAFDLQRMARIFATKYPHTDFERLEPGNSRAVLGPGGAVDFAPIRMSRALTFDERSAVAKGEMAIYVYGSIKYRDIYQVTRCANFRLMYRGNGGGISAAPVPLEQLPEGNNYECPD